VRGLLNVEGTLEEALDLCVKAATDEYACRIIFTSPPTPGVPLAIEDSEADDQSSTSVH
jgi:hypothetical protein